MTETARYSAVPAFALRVRRSTLVEQTVTAVIEYLSVSGLRPNDKLPSEKDLAEMLGVGRVALREALVQLRALGLIDARQGSGWFLCQFRPVDTFRVLSPLLRHFTSADLDQIMQVRMVLEPWMAGVVAARLSAEGLAALEKQLAGMAANVGAKEKFVEYDIAFHAVLAEESGNTVLAALCAILTDLTRSVQWAYPDAVDYRERTVELHRGVFEAIRSGDAKRAEKAMRKHLTDVWESIERKNG